MQQHPRVGVGVIVRRGGQILLGQRCGPTYKTHPALFLLTADHDYAQEGVAGRRRMGAARCDEAPLAALQTLSAAETWCTHSLTVVVYTYLTKGRGESGVW